MKQPQGKDGHLHIRVSQEDHDKLKQIAATNGVTVSQVARKLLEGYINRNKTKEG